MSSDTTTGTRTDAPWREVGAGQPITRSCDARKGAWLCGAKVSFKGICTECAKVRDERKARAAA